MLIVLLIIIFIVAIIEGVLINIILERYRSTLKYSKYLEEMIEFKDNIN